MDHYAFYVFTELSTPFATNEQLRYPALAARDAVNELRGCVPIKKATVQIIGQIGTKRKVKMATKIIE